MPNNKLVEIIPLQSAADRAPLPAVTPIRPAILGHLKH